MAWPCRTELWGAGLEAARVTVSELATAIAEFEPVTMIARPDLTAGVSLYLRQGVPVLPLPHDDSRIRDTGPSLLVGAAAPLAGVAFRFDGWGNRWPEHSQDARLGGRLIEHLGARPFSSQLALDASQFHHDGLGTALVSAANVLDLNRNPGLDQAAVEAELGRCLAIDKVVWLPHRMHDAGSGVPPDAPFCFLGPGLVMASVVDDPADPDHDGLNANLEVLRTARDARGGSFEILTLPLPRSTRTAGRPAMTYTSLYMANGGLVMAGFGDPMDKAALRAVAAAVPKRRVVQVDMSGLVAGASGIFALTRDQPAV